MEIKNFIREAALNLGFDKVGFAKAEEVSSKEKFLEWLKQDYHGEMKWMENYQEKRLNPALLVENGKTIIVLATNYYHNTHHHSEFQISRYAVGQDYHDLIRSRMKQLLVQIQEIDASIQGRVFVDSAPILERYWAEKAGIGWQGKNSLLITPEFGSYVFLSEIIVNLEIESDLKHSNRCGTCRRCLEACPTQAIVTAYCVDAKKCISYLSIEKRNELNSAEASMLGKHLFGCDICQEVCPWNRFAKLTKTNEFKNVFDWQLITLDDILEWTDEDFKKFKTSPVSRSKLSGIKRNALIVKENHAFSQM